jgi:hypothetical protein
MNGHDKLLEEIVERLKEFQEFEEESAQGV